VRMVAVSDFSGLTSSAWALAKAEASAATDSLDRGIGRLRLQHVKAYGARFRALCSHAVPDGLPGILGRPITYIGVANGAIRDCVFRGAPEPIGNIGISQKASIGAYCYVNNGVIDNCDFAGFYDAIRIKQYMSVRDSQIEMCDRGIVVGMDEDGVDYPSAATIEGMEMEANNIHTMLNNCIGGAIRMCGMLGDPFTGVVEDPRRPGQCEILVVNPTSQMIWESIGISGVFTDAGIKFNQPGADWAIPLQECVLMAVKSEIGDPRFPEPNAVNWRGMEFLDRNRVTFIQCNNP
jgi:hypothetical protein